MPTCVPIKELKNTKSFTQLVEQSNEPIFVTKNGLETMVVMTPQQYDEINFERYKARILEALQRSEEDVRSGRVHAADEVLAQLRNRNVSTASVSNTQE